MTDQMMNFKIEVSIKALDIKNALKERNIIPNKANMDRMIKMIKNGRFIAKEEMLDELSMDKEILLMYGFTFKS